MTKRPEQDQPSEKSTSVARMENETMAKREFNGLALHERLRYHRQRRSMTLRQVSIASDVTESHLSQIERGEVHDPRLRTILKIADALAVPVEALVRNLPEERTKH